MAKYRVDWLVVQRGLAASREQAQALILAGEILVDGQKAAKPGHAVSPDCELTSLAAPPRFASRGGFKLEAALEAFPIPVAGRVALDIGSSTGGFTDCLLQRGARRVHAVDSGTNQMIWRLRTDPRVHLLENTNARYLTPDQIGEPVEVLVMDASFISAALLLPPAAALLAPAADVVVLAKPQFEAGRGAVGKGGIVRDPAARAAAVERVRQAVAAVTGGPTEVIPSPLRGAAGNQEYLVWSRRETVHG